jgi:hypothetical protein
MLLVTALSKWFFCDPVSLHTQIFRRPRVPSNNGNRLGSGIALEHRQYGRHCVVE